MSVCLRGFIYVISGSILWGASGSVAQYFFAKNAVSTECIVGLRLLGAGFLLSLWAFFTQRKQLTQLFSRPKDIGHVLLFGFAGVVPSQFTYFMAIRLGNAPTATILQFLNPVFILLYYSIRQRTAPRRIDLLSIVLAIAGTFLLVTHGSLNQLVLSPWAVFWGIMAGIAATLYTLLPRNLLRTYDATLVTGLAMLAAGIALLPFILREWPLHLSRSSILSLAFIIIFGTLFSYLFYLKSLQFINPTTTSLLSSFEPLTATFLSVLFLNTLFDWSSLVGMGLILSTTILQALASKLPFRRYRDKRIGVVGKPK